MSETTLLFFRNHRSDKFYEATLDGCTVRFRWGRRDTEGQRDEKTFGGPGLARNCYALKIEEKLAKGYLRQSYSLYSPGYRAATMRTPVPDPPAATPAQPKRIISRPARRE